MKNVTVSVVNDLVTDQRVHKVCTTLCTIGYKVTLVGRIQKNSLPLNQRNYLTKRIKLITEKGPLFYFAFNTRLFLHLLFNKNDLLVANDLDTLLPNYIVSKLKRIPLVYDTHEIFTEVPELQNSRIKKKIWEWVEGLIFPNLSNVFTVNKSIAQWYNKKYGVTIKVVRNVPYIKNESVLKTRSQLGLPDDKKIVIMQGAGINIQRGAEEALEAMKYVNNALLLIIGGGDIIEELKKRAGEEYLNDKVKFIGKKPYNDLMHYTRNADVGLSLDKDTNINYRYSLPNKLFDYIHAGIAVLASPLPEVAKVIREYDTGVLIDSYDPEHIAEKINYMLNDIAQLNKWKENSKLAAHQLKWENEENELIAVYKNFL